MCLIYDLIKFACIGIGIFCTFLTIAIICAAILSSRISRDEEQILEQARRDKDNESAKI